MFNCSMPSLTGRTTTPIAVVAVNTMSSAIAVWNPSKGLPPRNRSFSSVPGADSDSLPMELPEMNRRNT